jgi:hypothetical protein
VIPSGIGEIVSGVNPKTIVDNLVATQQGMYTLQQWFTAVGGLISTAGQIRHKLKYNPETQSPPYYQSEFLRQSIPYERPRQPVKVEISLFAKMRSLLTTILTLSVVGFLAAGGFMAFANRDAIQDFVEDRIQPMVDRLNIDQVYKYLSLISKKITNYIQHSSSPIVAKFKSKFLKQTGTPLRSQKKTSVKSVRGEKNTRITSSRSKSDHRRVKNKKSARITSSRSKSARR